MVLNVNNCCLEFLKPPPYLVIWTVNCTNYFLCNFTLLVLSYSCPVIDATSWTVDDDVGDRAFPVAGSRLRNHAAWPSL